MTTFPSQPMYFLFVVLALALTARAANYSLTDNWVGESFLHEFSWQAIPDPTNGRVEYLSKKASRNLNLTYASSDRFILKADSNTTLTASDPGRNSNRIQSKKTFGSNTVLVADINHLPAGCGTWPALWTTDVPNWPNMGEIDILEGTNDLSTNTMSLHATATCMIPAAVPALGHVNNTDCNWQTNGDTGCNFLAPGANSYGPQFNSAGGGWYAMERTPAFIKIWFWSRQDPSVPLDVKTLGQNLVDTDSWGTPVSFFPSTSCDISSKFGAHNVIINLTFCGDWAGKTFATSGCPGTCVDYVNGNPAAFQNAFWDFNAVRMYGA